MASDIQIQLQNEQRYRSQRGRRCETCDAKIRYTKELPFCEEHFPTDYYDVDPVAISGFKTPTRKRGPKFGVPLPRLREFRQQRFKHASHLAALTGLSPSTVRKIEHGQGTKQETAEKLAAVLGVCVEDLL